VSFKVNNKLKISLLQKVGATRAVSKKYLQKWPIWVYWPYETANAPQNHQPAPNPTTVKWMSATGRACIEKESRKNTFPNKNRRAGPSQRKLESLTGIITLC